MYKLRQSWLKRLTLLAALAALLALPGLAGAQESVTVPLASRGGSAVVGTAVLTAEGDGTNVVLNVSALPATATARVVMTAGTCDQPGASFAELPNLKADASGKAAATGKVLFRGTENVALATMADGQHVIMVQTDQVVACGVIPLSASGAVTAAGMPETGGMPGWFMALVAALVLGLLVLVAALVLNRRRAVPRA